MNKNGKAKFSLLLFIASLAGAAALGHQVVWIRVMVDILGANADTYSKVAGCFFFGLALGAGLASLRQPPPPRRWLWLALTETAVLTLAWPPLLLYPAADLLYRIPVFTNPLQWLVPLLLTTPPAVMTGLFLPWLFHALECENRLTAGRSVILYALNTMGGAVAIAGILFLLFPTLGLTGTALSVMILNATVAVCFLWLHYRAKKSVIIDNANILSQTESAPQSTRLKFSCLLAFTSGFAMLSQEVIFRHQIAQISVNSTYSGGAVLGTVILCLGVASLLVPVLKKLIPDSSTLLITAMALTAVVLLFQPLYFHYFNGLRILPAFQLAPAAYGWLLLRRTLLAIGPAMLIGGMIFPILLFHTTLKNPGTAGRSTARLFLWNGLGGWTGAEAANIFLAPLAGLWQSIPVIAVVYLAFMLWLTISGSARFTPIIRLTVVTSVIAAALVMTLYSFHVTGDIPYIAESVKYTWTSESDGNPRPETERLIDYKLGPEGLIAVLEAQGHLRILQNNSYVLSGSFSAPHQERQGILPVLLHGNAKTAGLLGSAAGISMAGAALYPELEIIEGIELSSTTQELAEKHFTPFNRDIFSDPRVQVYVEDARMVIAGKKEYYDVVIGGVFLPWKTGTGRLYTSEHFRAVKKSLKPGGIYCQWLPLYQLTESQFQTILATFQDVFPETTLLSVDFFSQTPIIGLAGGFSLRDHDWDQTRNAISMLRRHSDTKDPLIRHLEGVKLMVLGEAPETDDDVPRNTLRNAWIELNAGQNVLGVRKPWFKGKRFIDFANRVLKNSNDIIPMEYEKTAYFFELDHAVYTQNPNLLAKLQQVTLMMPPALLNDSQADWMTWPSLIAPVFNQLTKGAL